jgi:hypothetical protein
MKKAHEQVTTGSPEQPGLPCAMVLTAYFVLSPVTGLFCHRRLRGNNPAKLDASVGASGPHGFAVRNSAARLASPKRPPHPVPNVRDDRDTPLLWGRDGAEEIADLGWASSLRSSRATHASAAEFHIDEAVVWSGAAGL